MICANPDLVVIRGGVRCCAPARSRCATRSWAATCAGSASRIPAIYAPVLELLGLPPKPRVLAVGDALRTDIAGAAAIGVDACWVLGGIHAAELGRR